MKMKMKVVSIIVLLLMSVNLSAQFIEDFAVHLRGGADLPLGSRSALFDEDAAYLIGGSLSIGGQYIFPDLPLLYLEGNVNVGLEPSQAQLLTLGSVGGGVGIDLRIGDTFSWQLGPDVGGTMGIYPSGDPAFNPYFGGRTAMVFDLNPGFAVSVGGSYRYHLGYDEAADEFTDLYQGVSIYLGGVFRFNPESGRKKIGVTNIETDPVFPVFYSYYEDHPLGRMTIKNIENSSITNVDIYFDVGEYMEQPMLCESIESLGRNQEAVVDINALFTGRILNLTESTKVSADIRVDYTYLGERFSFNYPQTIRILDRNSMTWDDDRKAASFVTSRDPTVLIFSKNTAGLIRDLGENPLNLNFRIGMGVFEALRLYGLNYVIDPKSSYIQASEDEFFLDYLQFPSQSLIYRAGDCDDLSILMSALMESVGIETAFITVPGHIFMAFSLGLTEEEAKEEFANTEDFIFMNGDTWVPVESTLVQQGFLKAFSTGAKQWRDAVRQDVAGFFPIHKAWEQFEPVGFTSGTLSLLFPSAESIIENYRESLDAFVSKEIRAKVEYYEDRISRKDSAKTRNSLGILYGRYGLFDEAEEQFKVALRLDSGLYNPVFNLGNIYFLKRRYEDALEYYQRAERLKPDNPLVVAGLARTKFELENFDDAQDDYRRLLEINPMLAENYNYIGNAGNSIVRASAALDKGKTYWDEEE
ncbi:MAG: tetratricopeptide repeat protein [Spirochaetales bacterium]|nr:tetratricopeptide repeat protein [Spirochaetales bacterium]